MDPPHARDHHGAHLPQPLPPLLLLIRLWPREVRVPEKSGPDEALLPATIALRAFSEALLRMPPPNKEELLARVLLLSVSVPLLRMPPP